MKRLILIIVLCAAAVGATWFVQQCGKCEKGGVIEAIEGRRSIRKYSDKAVEREKLQKVAECGVAAPSAMNLQDWELRIVDSKEWIDACTAIFVEQIQGTPMAEKMLTPDFKNMFRNAPAVIFVAAKSDKFSDVNIGLLGSNMMLAAYELGLGTCCLGMPLMVLNEQNPKGSQMLASLGFSEGYTLRYALAVGYPDESPEAKPRDLSKIRFVE